MSQSLEQQLFELRESCVVDEEAEKEQQRAAAQVCVRACAECVRTWRSLGALISQ